MKRSEIRQNAVRNAVVGLEPLQQTVLMRMVATPGTNLKQVAGEMGLHESIVRGAFSSALDVLRGDPDLQTSVSRRRRNFTQVDREQGGTVIELFPASTDIEEVLHPPVRRGTLRAADLRDYRMGYGEVGFNNALAELSPQDQVVAAIFASDTGDKPPRDSEVAAALEISFPRVTNSRLRALRHVSDTLGRLDPVVEKTRKKRVSQEHTVTGLIGQFGGDIYRNALAGLDPMDQDILNLDESGYSLKEIGEKVGMSHQAVLNFKGRALKLLANRLAAQRD